MLYTRNTKKNKRQENSKICNLHYHNQYIKYVQHKNVKMSGDYWKFRRHLVAAETFKTRGRNTIILHHHYRVDPELGKVVFDIRQIPCAYPACVSQLIKN